MSNKDKRWVFENEFKSKSSLEDLKFVFDHAEKLLKTTIDNSTTITNKGNSIVTITVTLLAGLVAYLIKRWDDHHQIDPLIFTAGVGIIYYYIIIAVYLNKNLKPTDYKVSGSMPKNLIQSRFYKVDPPPNKGRLYWFYLNEIQSYQERIDFNLKTNEDRWKIYRSALKGLVYSPLVLLLTYIVKIYI